MIKEVLPSSTSTKVTGPLAKVSKEDQAVENTPTDIGLFGLVLQSVQQIKEELQPKSEPMSEDEDPLLDVEATKVGTEDKGTSQDILVSEPSVKAVQQPEATENITKLKLSVAKITKTSLEDGKNIEVIKSEQEIQFKTVANVEAENKIVEDEPRSATTEQPIIKKPIESLTTVTVQVPIKKFEEEGVTAQTTKRESPISQKIELTTNPVQVKNVAVTETNFIENLTVTEKVLGNQAELKGIQNQKIEPAPSSSTNPWQATEVLKELDEPLQKTETLEKALIPKAEKAVKMENPTTQKVELTHGLEQIEREGTTEIRLVGSLAESETVLPIKLEHEAKEVLKKELIQKTERTTKEAEPETGVGKLATSIPAEGTVEFTNALPNSKAEENRAKRYRQHHFSNDRGVAVGDRLTLITAKNVARTQVNQNPEFSNLVAATSASMGTDSSFNLTQEQEILLKEQMIESTEMKEQKNNDRYNMGYLRLGEMPVNNLSIRRNVLPSLTQMMRASSHGKDIPETWQKHSIELEDGNRIQLSTRNVDGLIQVILASPSLELSKLMQTHGQDIKNHLEQECELNIDLQFDNQPNQNMDNFFGSSSDSPQNQSRSLGGETSLRKDGKQAMEQPIQQSVRKFGYNQMEWTV